ncbi:UTP--glucose-1-phosphate uridylyltransferase GalU [Parvibaculum sp.]|uniref:UTP--glucose-1-phosphate uridylyltransferase GalU n=1 Tax=Parvibaculum sp. TaxID=2024848 RepID=UPI001B1E974C|nr:UTP--glucose-1-phosphate uridylyltransferase GalU [Parvibaculum sp.]MBO6636286.1 UTP--glucose-1-phosphate uridylyltransferase GalU [Parvibaculum sp.]MBO6679295.1 UTP--glucose-1-phosphate uridylyltransferase GalU [Parvibaculum sp.]MBO6685432.1 UTP--glucose-1-phosphate uridylyltransferase GalU [Parvibaculum sp.]MBO6904327.1 UTP--glucose-1-phosphate uridylyltransferase GalU [Parvibaculum sp.]
MNTASAKKVRKAVFPVAGLGTRFLPATKVIPKEMLTVVDKPVIQYAVDEAIEAGIEHFVFVTGRGKGAIEDHFDLAYELEATLKARGKTAEFEMLKASRPAAGAASFVRQQEPLGLGHAVWCARDIVGDEPFALALPDMLIHGKRGCFAQMIDTYSKHGGNIIAAEEVPHEHVNRYGVLALTEDLGNQTHRITGMVEKPKIEDAPSNLIISGRYILQPEIFAKLETQKPGAGGEIQLTDAMIALLAEQDFFSYRFEGTTYDCGDKIGYLAANVAIALSRSDIEPKFRPVLEKLIRA